MLYPFTFKPILKKVIWGGSDICPFKGITPVENGVGESWELSHVEGNYSIVDNGELEGKSLDELIRSYGKELLGEKVMERFGTTFPLLIKFIDAVIIYLFKFTRTMSWRKSATTLSVRRRCGM